MPDLGDHEWPEMVRITTANVGIDAVELALNFSYSPSVEVAVEFNMSTQPSPLMPQQRPPNKGLPTKAILSPLVRPTSEKPAALPELPQTESTLLPTAG